MFKLATNVRSPQAALAMLLSVAVLLWSVGVYTTAQAANLVELSNTLTDSAPSAESGHEIRFLVPSGSDIDGSITIEFPSGFTGFAGIDGTNTAVTFGGSGTAGTPSGSGETITIPSVSAASDEEVVITVDEGVLTNPSTTGSYRITVTTETSADGPDVGNTHVVIVDTVLVTASIETVFEFEIEGLATGTTPTGLEETTGSTTATAIPFGVLTPDTEYFLAQDLFVTTNARNGYVVTVEQDQDLLSSTGAVISPFIDGAYTDSAAAWVAPSRDVLDDETWGHWGLTSNDTTLETLYGGRGLTGDFVAASTTPRLIMAHDASSDGETQDVGFATVGYKIEVTTLQEAAEDYTTTLTYIATPTF